MYPNSFKQKQQGFLLPLAIFIVVVMGLFALVLSRNTIQTGTSALQEVISTQAFYAAESGAQRGMQNLFFNADISRLSVDSRCNAMIASNASNNHTFTAAGLNNCSATVTCRCLYQNDAACSPGTATNYSSTNASAPLTSYYTIISAATCGSGNLNSVRTIEVGSFLRQE